MARYKVQWDYTSSYGTYEKGDTVEVDEALAEAVDRDSPGVLSPIRGKAVREEEEKEEESPTEELTVREATVPADRQQRRRRTRS